jgi:hypothetical protein
LIVGIVLSLLEWFFSKKKEALMQAINLKNSLEIAAVDVLYTARSRIYEGISKLALRMILKPKEDIQTEITSGIKYRVVKPEGKLDESRVALFCGGFFDHIEMNNEGITKFAEVIKAPVYIFNYPGINGSKGTYLDLSEAKKAFQIMLKHIEASHPNKKIICIGNSMGGTVLEGIDGLELEQETKVTYILDRSPSSICDLANEFVPRLGDLFKYVGFDLDAFKAIKDRGITPIVIQSANVSSAKVIRSEEYILENDDFLPRKSTFASKVLQERFSCSIIGDPAKHFDPLTAVNLLPLFLS